MNTRRRFIANAKMAAAAVAALAAKMPIGRWSVGAAVADDALVRFNLAKRIGEPWKKVVVESGLAVVLAFALFVWRRSR